MADAALTGLIDTFSRARRVGADDVLALRRAIYGDDGMISAREAEALIALDEAVADGCGEWKALFLEALTDFVVRQQQPADYIDDAKAAWLIERLTRDGRLKTDTELELLAHMLEAATTAPQRLIRFTLDQLKAAVIDGEGPLLRGGSLAKGKITAGEVDLVRRILYAAGGDGNVAITRAEAEALFDINDACAGGEVDPSWTDLFAKAICASVMSVSGFRPASREDEARREAWMCQADSSGFTAVALFINKMFAGGAAREDGLSDWNDYNAETERELAEAEVVTEDEARWLADRIGRDGRFCAAERAAIGALKRTCPQIHPALRPLLDAA